MSLYASDQSLNTEVVQRTFMNNVEPLHVSLQWYCRAVTGSHFEAEDLAQETIMKAYSMFIRYPYKQEISKAYLFRIASNSWIDRCRKDKLLIDSNLDPLQVPTEETFDVFELEAAMETLVANLPPRQRVILLLIDALRYTASEVAELLRTTEGAIKAALNRARTKLQQLNSKELLADDWSNSNKASQLGCDRTDDKVVYAYLAAFRSGDPQALILLLNDGAPLDLVPTVTAQSRTIPSSSKYNATNNYTNHFSHLHPLDQLAA